MNKTEAIEILKDKAYLFHGEEVKALSMAIEALEQEPKHGKWIQAKDVEIEYAVCTNCTHHGEFYMRYCPNCGARMESDTE